MKTRLIRIREDDFQWVDQMCKKLIMTDGEIRFVADVLHTILKNARALADDELELLQEG